MNILCLWLLQYGVRVPVRLRLPTRETLVELIPLAPRVAATPAPKKAGLTQSTHRVNPHPAATAISQDQPLSHPDVPKPVASAPEHKLDMEALRIDARQMGDQGKNDPDGAIKLNLRPATQEAPTTLSQEMGKAQRTSCKTAHANQGLLAPLALLHDAATGTGCSWQ